MRTTVIGVASLVGLGAIVAAQTPAPQAPDQPTFRAGVRLALEAAGHCVLGEASSVDDAAQVLERQPNLVVIHAESALGDVLGTLRDLAAAGHGLRILVIAPDGAPEETAEAVRLGVVGVLPPTIDAELLRRCLQVVSAGEFWIRRDDCDD